MQRRLVVVGLALLVFGVVGLLIPYLQKVRVNANLAQSRFNLGQLTFFAAHHANPDPRQNPGLIPKEIPPATVILPGVAPENRLSWAVSVLPWLSDQKHAAEELVWAVKTDKPWTDDANQQAGRARLAIFLCPENTPQVSADTPGMTCYVGITGLGRDAATLTLSDNLPTPPRAGAFRYDGPTPFDRIADGLSQTLLMGETANAPGSWLRGGPSTARGFDDATGAKGLIGTGGQFGGFFPTGANFALCDGSVRLFTPQTTPGVLFRMATIAGGKEEGGPPD